MHLAPRLAVCMPVRFSRVGEQCSVVQAAGCTADCYNVVPVVLQLAEQPHARKEVLRYGGDSTGLAPHSLSSGQCNSTNACRFSCILLLSKIIFEDFVANVVQSMYFQN